ncbi:PH domain-containing protein [Oscillospiraceae bacterium PP1C4]
MTLKKPDLHVLNVWRIRLVLAAIAPAFLSAYFFLHTSRLWWIFSAAWVLAFFFLYICYFPIRYRKLSYTLNKYSLLIHCGVFYTLVKAIPFTNIQYASVFSTPLERKLGLCSLFVYSAGSTSYIPGLPLEEAMRIQHILTPDEPGGDPLA